MIEEVPTGISFTWVVLTPLLMKVDTSVDRMESPFSDQENVDPITCDQPAPVTSEETPLSVETDTNPSVGGQCCHPRVPFADRMRAIGRIVPTPRSRESRVVSHLETNRRARRQARELLLQHGVRFPVELLNTDSGSESESSVTGYASGDEFESNNDSNSGQHGTQRALGIIPRWNMPGIFLD